MYEVGNLPVLFFSRFRIAHLAKEGFGKDCPVPNLLHYSTTLRPQPVWDLAVKTTRPRVRGGAGPTTLFTVFADAFGAKPPVWSRIGFGDVDVVVRVSAVGVGSLFQCVAGRKNTRCDGRIALMVHEPVLRNKATSFVFVVVPTSASCSSAPVWVGRSTKLVFVARRVARVPQIRFPPRGFDGC